MLTWSVDFQAFVGYRDYGDEDRVVVRNFVEKQNFQELQAFIGALEATGGDDAAEDIAGGLAVSLVL